MKACRILPTFWLIGTVGALCSGLWGQSPANASAAGAAEPAIELPTFTVQDSPILPEPEAWRYAHIEGFEVLSNSSNRTTQRLVEDFQRFHQALVLAWPAADIPSAVPTSLILVGRGNKFDPFVPRIAVGPEVGSISLNLRDGELSAIVIDLETTTLNLVTPEGIDAFAAQSAAASDPAAEDAGATLFSGMPNFVVDHYRQLYREYIRFILTQSQPRLPAWMEEGLAQIFMRMEFSPTRIVIGKVEDPNEVSIDGSIEDRDFNHALHRRALMPLQEMFSVTRDSTTARNPLGNRWAKQSYAFVHLCLYGNQGKYQKGLLMFLSRLGSRPPSEELFKECFGMTYKQMLLQIRGYVDFTAYKAVVFQAKKGTKFEAPPKPVFRDATDAEVGRIKGEALRMAGNKAAARMALIAPYIRGSRDPQLLASLGMYEYAEGETTRARKFLEAAAKEKVNRPRAYLQLAQLRFDEAMRKPLGARQQLSAAQVSEILDPLFVARGQTPTLPEVYEMIATVWSKSQTPPTAGNLAVIDEGVQRFIKRSDWIYQAALLKQQYGFLEDAAVLAEIGLRVTADSAKRQRFQALKAALPPVSHQASAKSP
ncbi:MAG: hypothetical protein K1X42_09235 [Opitutaceae bacterium]|nr:hypothetical protein [Opitutaceae bacterium]